MKFFVQTITASWSKKPAVLTHYHCLFMAKMGSDMNWQWWPQCHCRLVLSLLILVTNRQRWTGRHHCQFVKKLTAMVKVSFVVVAGKICMLTKSSEYFRCKFISLIKVILTTSLFKRTNHSHPTNSRIIPLTCNLLIQGIYIIFT
jgi:hypothetical protein